MSWLKRVEVGARLLDRIGPGWFLRINPRTFDMDDRFYCVTAQVFGDFDIGYNAHLHFGIGTGQPAAIDAGFEPPREFSTKENYVKLTERWRQEICKRLDLWITFPQLSAREHFPRLMEGHQLATK